MHNSQVTKERKIVSYRFHCYFIYLFIIAEEGYLTEKQMWKELKNHISNQLKEYQIECEEIHALIKMHSLGI
jgi:hypothetical protein